jgi:hypothetical protein
MGSGSVHSLSGEIVEQYLLDVARAEDKSAQLDVIIYIVWEGDP